MNRNKYILIMTIIIAIFSTVILKPSRTNEQEAVQNDKVLNVGTTFSYSSLDAHKDFYGWYTSMYGMTETLFKQSDDNEIVPWLAESAERQGRTWTITLKEMATFSNGKKLTAEMAVRNLERVADINKRFAYYEKYVLQPVDDRTFTILTEEEEPTLINELSDPAFAMIDLDYTSDFDKWPITTGPFIINTFQAGNIVKVVKNENYWNGETKLNGAVFRYITDDTTRMLAMMNGEIDCYTNVTEEALLVYQEDKENFKVTTIPSTRIQYYILNQNRLNDAVRKAINSCIDSEEICALFSQTLTPAVGPFGANTKYGQVTKPAVDIEKAKTILETDGYKIGSSGYYEKEGQLLEINIAYYASRSLDMIAMIMQQQLKRIGIKAILTCQENPDATYIRSGDFDIALYSMIADKNSDPYYFIANTIAEDSYYNCGEFSSETVNQLIKQLDNEEDLEKRAQLANKIVQIAIDNNAFGYVAYFNKSTVTKNGVSGYSEANPFDFYGLTAQTDKE